jgi:hypothetical protein
MTTELEPDLHRKARLLVAAVQLRKTHGILYAMRFLEDHDFSTVVIWEVLNLIPSGVLRDSKALSSEEIDHPSKNEVNGRC